MTQDKDYILGTHDEEIERLGLQHRVWRPKATGSGPKAFVAVGVERMRELGSLTSDEAEGVRNSLANAENDPHALMVTPAVIEIIATKSL
ncbi:MAG: hypothetical protein ACR2L6_08180 [Gemmatimonadaceae bacterium]